MVELVNYFREYEQVMTYSIILVSSIIYSIFKDKDLRQTGSLFIITVCFVTSPIVRQVFQDKGFFLEDREFFLFYSLYELYVCALLVIINYGHRRVFPLYMLHVVGATINHVCYMEWYNYSNVIYDFYEHINRFLMDFIILVTVALNNRERFLIGSTILIFIPYLIRLIH